MVARGTPGSLWRRSQLRRTLQEPNPLGRCAGTGRHAAIFPLCDTVGIPSSDHRDADVNGLALPSYSRNATESTNHPHGLVARIPFVLSSRGVAWRGTCVSASEKGHCPVASRGPLGIHRRLHDSPVWQSKLPVRSSDDPLSLRVRCTGHPEGDRADSCAGYFGGEHATSGFGHCLRICNCIDRGNHAPAPPALLADGFPLEPIHGATTERRTIRRHPAASPRNAAHQRILHCGLLQRVSAGPNSWRWLPDNVGEALSFLKQNAAYVVYMGVPYYSLRTLFPYLQNGTDTPDFQLLFDAGGQSFGTHAIYVYRVVPS